MATELQLNDEFWLKVKIQEGRAVYGLQCEIVYPPEILNAVLNGNGTVQTRMGGFLGQNGKDASLSASLDDDQQGRVVLGCSKHGSASGSSGEGVLCEVLMKCTGLGKGEIRFEQSKIYNPDLEEQPSKWIPARVDVVAINVVSAEIEPRSLPR